MTKRFYAPLVISIIQELPVEPRYRSPRGVFLRVTAPLTTVGLPVSRPMSMEAWMVVLFRHERFRTLDFRHKE